VIGANVRGNQNLLEAVELAGSLRSHRTQRQDLIRHCDPAALIRARLGDDQLET